MKSNFGKSLAMGLIAIMAILAFMLLMPTPRPAEAGGYNIFNPGFGIVRGGVADTTLKLTNMDATDILWGAILIDTIAAGVVKPLAASHFTCKADSIKVDTVTTAKYIILFWQNTHDD